MLETFTLKQKYQQAREELANALYEQDAACRVIARLKDERDSAREALATLKASAVPAAAAAAARSPKTKAAPAAMDVDESAAASKMPESIAAAVVDVSQALSQTRRKRKAPEGHTPKETVSTFKSVATVANLHTASAPGMLALDVSPHDADQVVTAGVDKSLKVVQRSDDGGQEVATLKGHTKKVNAVQWHAEREGLIVSGSADNTVKLWQPAGKDDKYKAVGTIKAHSDEVTAVSM